MIDAIARGALDAGIAVVVSNHPSARALDRAKQAGVPTEIVPHQEYPSRERFDLEVVNRLKTHNVNCVVLAGFMRIVTPILLDAFPRRVLNIHPSLLPAFPGMHAQRQALHYGVKVTGCTVHLVDGGTDTGPVVGQRSVPVFERDTEETLTERVLQQEHELLPQALQWIAEDRLELIEGESRARVRIRARP